jgi:riboflavin biosynthesis pyrimidine reductase
MTAVLHVPRADRMTDGVGDPLQTLWEDDDALSLETRGSGMPIDLERRYGGLLTIPLRSDRPTVMANFVSTIDGIVALGTGELSGGGLISGFHEPDRFVMGLLRALADVVVVGAGTLRGSDAHRWTPAHVHPASAASFAAWRAAMGLPPVPTTVIVTAGGDIPTDHPGLADPGIPVVVATTPAGASRLAIAGLGDHVRVHAVKGASALSAGDVLRLASQDGGRLVLTEGGPHLLGSFVDADLLDELFLTVSPQLVGRAGGERLGLLEGLALPPNVGRWQDLVSVRRSADHLFLRYRRRRDAADKEA